MSIFAIYFELNRKEVKSYKSRYTKFTKELEKGRNKNQITLNGSIAIIKTPETLKSFTKRILHDGDIDIENDRFAVIDMASGRIFVWGDFEHNIKEKFPFIVMHDFPSES